MKKFLALVMAMMMVLAMGTAFAEGTADASGYVSEEVTKAITLNKIYTLSGSTDATLYPTETLSFSVEAGKNNPDTPVITVDDLEVKGNSDQKVVINLPVYDTVGIYTYTITEDAGEAQGVVYSDAALEVTVMVTYNYTDACLDTKVVVSSTSEGSKADTFDNQYNVGALTVQKTVSGNLASHTDYFKMKVTLTATQNVESAITVSGGSHKSNPTTIANDWTGAKEVEIWLKANETITFANIPDGVTYTVVEDAAHILQAGETFDPNSAGDKQYTATYTNASGEIETKETDAAVVNNEKKTDVDTGILLDNAPYMMIMAMVVLAGAAMMMKRRAY